jgi:hypothetical protein
MKKKTGNQSLEKMVNILFKNIGQELKDFLLVLKDGKIRQIEKMFTGE